MPTQHERAPKQRYAQVVTNSVSRKRIDKEGKESRQKPPIAAAMIVCQVADDDIRLANVLDKRKNCIAAILEVPPYATKVFPMTEERRIRVVMRDSAIRFVDNQANADRWMLFHEVGDDGDRAIRRTIVDQYDLVRNSTRAHAVGDFREN
jgi:hypothetical protein